MMVRYEIGEFRVSNGPALTEKELKAAHGENHRNAPFRLMFSTVYAL